MEEFNLDNFQSRRTQEEKDNFIKYLTAYLESIGYKEDDIIMQDFKKRYLLFGACKGKNIIVGDLENAKIVVSAHYDTARRLILSNTLYPTSVLLNLLKYTWYIFMTIALLTGMLLLQSSQAYPLIILATIIAWYWYLKVANKSNKVHSANDNTSGVMAVTEILKQLSEEEREKICVVYFDKEEVGYIGSRHFAWENESIMKDKLLLNFDCVGDGEHIIFAPQKDAKKDSSYEQLKKSFGTCQADHNVEFMEDIGITPLTNSDHKKFHKGIGVYAAKKMFWYYVIKKIHTNKDTCCRMENIEFLAAAVKHFISTQ